MKFTHRTVGPKKGSGFSPVAKIKKPPKEKPRGTMPTKYSQDGPFARIAVKRSKGVS